MADAELLERLEASLQKRWDFETLTVYADCLASHGDPRGSLIALDLAQSRGHGRVDDEERQSLLRDWLGPAATRIRSRFGMIESVWVSEPPELAWVRDAPAATFIRSLELSGDGVTIGRWIDQLAARDWPWLTRLAIRQRGPGPVLKEVAEAFIRATPNLRALSVSGSQVIATPFHPNVRSLRIGEEALIVTDHAMPNVTGLSLVARSGWPESYAAICNPRLFPQLRRLDLAENEYRYPTSLGTNRSVFLLLRSVENLARVERLRLPAPRHPDDVDGLAWLSREHPTMHVDIARCYRESTELFESGASPATLPTPRPWPPRDTVSGRSALSILIPGERYDDEIALSSCIDELETVYDIFEPDVRAAWDQLWTLLDGLAWEDDDGNTVQTTYPASALELALASLADDRCGRIAAAIRRARLPPGATVRVSRYWGW